jgi:type IV secretory pathway VirJ component
MRRALLVVLWFVATAAITFIAHIAVNVAGASVSDRPLTSVVANGAIGSATTASQTTSPASTVTDSPTNVPSSDNSSTTSTTRPATSSTTSAATTTSAADSPAPWKQTTVNSLGGAVIVSYRPGEVRLESVAPLAGFSYDIDKAGPDEVRVEFEGDDLKAEIRVRWENGALLTTIDESD